jgi:hypothetical protein
LLSASSSSSSQVDGKDAATVPAPKLLYPKVGDMVRYYDLDGGQSKGQVIVGKISFISKTTRNNNNSDDPTCPWLVEVTEMDNLGDGYFADYPSRIRRGSKQTTRNLASIAPVSASFVRTENAWKVPSQKNKDGLGGLTILVRQEQYDWQDYQGPFGGDAATTTPMGSVNSQVLNVDWTAYQTLKRTLLKYTALTGLAGTIGVDLVRGVEDAVIYLAGALASVGYIILLSLKTDTMARSNGPKLGAAIANVRFLLPVLVIVCVALYNASLGDMNPVLVAAQSDADTFMVEDMNPFNRITPEQFASAILGFFVSYRLPLFASQIQEAFATGRKEDGKVDGGGGSSSGRGVTIPGSAGMALQVLTNSKKKKAGTTNGSVGDGNDDDDDLIPVLVVSGPQATGRSALVQQLIDQGGGKFVSPILLDRTLDPVTFEQLARRNQFLQIDGSDEVLTGNSDSSSIVGGRFGMTKEGILTAAAKAKEMAAALRSNNNNNEEEETDCVVVVDASVALAKKLRNLKGARLIGVWVGLTSVAAFEERLNQDIVNGTLVIPPEETAESVIRARIREIVSEIEFGISAGLFEFTILNSQNDDESSEGSSFSSSSTTTKALKELQEAARYCFK